ncbi:FUSC family protein [Streptomyces sp. NBC_01142]|uniref:FUSC family protein n=1 Tax=Streptomyces sp. NBC_01142 TaxID=2975865 RepID=UPI002259B20E|nr:FUSC family protein [Streptomyces sp. NBC_01142]MCX4825246.1 FUSC family protein [Streptomyces sp. NBC_01142]
MTWLRALREIVRSGLTIERTRLEPLVALRAAAGVAIVIGLALWLVSPAYAASSALGAFSAGAATFQRSWRPRKVIALAAGAGLALSTFLGYLAAGHLVTFLLLLATWSFVAGMAWAVGPTAGIVSAATVAGMLVIITLPTSVGQALEHAAVIALGGVVQATLILLFPIRRWGAHRDALADALAAVADYARRLSHDPTAPFDAKPMMTARSAAAVTPSQARRRPAALHGPRGLAERIRPAVAALADPRVGAPAEGPGRDRAREVLGAAADVLDAAARSIRRGTPAQVPSGAMETLRIDEGDEVLEGPARQAAVRLASLLGEVLETADSCDTHVVPAPARGAADAPPLLRPTMFRLVPVVLRAMRRELHRDSPVLRHAVRLATVACLGYALGTALPLGHGYWAPIASVMVMRPDFHQTYARAVARFTGTLVGVALATGVVQLAHPDAYLSGGLAVVSAALSYLLMRTGYVASQSFTAAYVVFLLGMGGEAWDQTVRDRVLLTLVGGALAVVAYVVFPAWETPRLLDRLADWLAANGRYAAAVVRGYGDPAGQRRADVRQALLASRDANAAWGEAFGRAKQEPVRHRGLTRREAEDAQEAVQSLGQAAMLLETHLPERGARPVPEAARFAEALEADTAQAAREVRARRNPDWDRVEEALDAWEGADSGMDPVVRRGAELQLQALEELATAVDRTPLERDVASSRQERHARAEEEEESRRERDTGPAPPPKEEG